MKIKLLTAAILVAAYLLPALCEAQAPTQAQLDAIEKIMAPQRQKVLAVLEADKTGQYAQYKADIDNIGKQTDPEKVRSLVAALESKHLAFIRKAYSNAKINNIQVKAEVAKVLGKIPFKFGEFADVQIDYTAPFAAPPPLRFEETLNCPFDALDENDNSALVAMCDANAGDCFASAFSIAEVAGGCRSKADVGGKIELPEGSYNKITVATQSDISYDGFVLSVGGYGQVNSKIGIRLRTDSGFDETVMVKEVVALAPVVWYNKVEGSIDNFGAQAIFSGNFMGGATITAQLHAETFAISAVIISFTVANAGTDTIDFIRVTGSN